MTSSNFSNYKLFDVIQRPLITEKTSILNEQSGKVGFIVSKESSKADIKKAVELVYNVKVSAVNTVLIKGKEKRFRGRIGQRSDIKKAYITLEKGHTIDIASGI